MKGRYKNVKNEEKVSFFLDNEPITPEKWREKYNSQKNKPRKTKTTTKSNSKAYGDNAKKNKAKEEDELITQLNALAMTDSTFAKKLEKLMKGGGNKKVSATSPKNNKVHFLDKCPPMNFIMLSVKDARGFKTWLQKQTSMDFIMSFKEINSWIGKFALSKHREDIKVLLNMLLLNINTPETMDSHWMRSKSMLFQ